MSSSRRQFLTQLSLAAAAALAARAQVQNPTSTTPGAPPAFGTAAPVGPEVSAATFQEAEKLVQINFTEQDLEQAAGNWRMAMAPLYERRVGPHKVEIPNPVAPWSRWDPVLPGTQQLPARNEFIRSNTDPGPLPAKDEDIAFATCHPAFALDTGAQAHLRAAHQHLSRAPGTIQSQAALRDHADRATSRCNRRSRPIGRSPPASIAARCTAFLGARKDLLDTAGIPTTYGAEPFRNRVPEDNAVVVQRLQRRWRGAGRQAQPRRAGAERYLVRRPDHEPLAAGRRLVGIERRTRRRDRCGTGRLRHRQRNRRQHRQPVDALRHYRTAPHLRPRGAHRRDDACAGRSTSSAPWRAASKTPSSC